MSAAFSGFLRATPDLAIEHAETSLRLSPRARVGTSLSLIGQAHFLARRFEETVPKLLLAIQDDPSFPAPYRYLTACYAHMGRLAEAQEITRRLRAIGGVVIPDTRNLRNAEHLELYLSGLRLASGEEGGVMAAPPRVDLPRDSVSIRHREAERRQITAMSCELVGAASGGDGAALEDLREAIGGFQRCVAEAADRHQGSVYRELGNCALVMFGYPAVHEHDGASDVFGDMNRSMAQAKFSFLEETGRTMMAVSSFAGASESIERACDLM